MLMKSPETEVCWRAARPCAEPEPESTTTDVTCRAWYRCEDQGDYVIKWRCRFPETREAGGGAVSDNGSAFSICSDQSTLTSGFTDCPPPSVCADESNQQAPVIVTEPVQLSTDLILVIAVTSFALLAILLTIASSYKYWSLRKKFRFPYKPGRYILREFPYPLRYHSLWGTGYSLGDFAPDTVKRRPSDLTVDLPVLFPEVNRSRSQSYYSERSRPFLPDVYFSKPTSDTILRPTSLHKSLPAPGVFSQTRQGPPGTGSNRDNSKPGNLAHASVSQAGHLGKKSSEGYARDNRRQDTSVATGSFIYHDPWGGNSPMWRVESTDGRGKHAEVSEGITEAPEESVNGDKKSERNGVKNAESSTYRVRERGSEWMHLYTPGPSHRSGHPLVDQSTERIHIYRGNLTTANGAASKNLKLHKVGDGSITSQLLKNSNQDNDLCNKTESAATHVSSIDIPTYDSHYRGFVMHSNGKQHSDRISSLTRDHERQIVSKQPAAARAQDLASNVYAQPLSTAMRKHPSNGSYNIDRPYSGNTQWPDASAGPINQNIRRGKIRANISDKTRISVKNKNTSAERDSRYMRVGKTIYRILPTAAYSDSNTSSNSSVGSRISKKSKLGFSKAYKVSGFDISYDNFRDGHLRQLTRRGDGAASSSTLEAGLAPMTDTNGLDRAESGRSSSATSQEHGSAAGHDRLDHILPGVIYQHRGGSVTNHCYSPENNIIVENPGSKGSKII
ncbi:hypothetical protein PoB_007040500 [Plakobranchus ocellatus]|uniref:Uncharacterized protein n=1 Tax=Plakobranchus ocellatus TaxID=259542 RepID=A0AAV4DID7_9GAST|nr:hypothetical protein PoB_007040500 [Plakobranchus ocellatus]